MMLRCIQAVIEGKGLETILTFGTGLGSAIFSDGKLAPHLEISHATIRYGKSIIIGLVNKPDGD
jgi:polyphosphate glucokinase